MRVQDAAAAVAYLTAMCPGFNDDATEQLVYEFEKLDDPVALGTAIQKVVRTWTATFRPPVGVIHDAYDAEVRAQIEASREINEAVRCDGHGWVKLAPCPACSPALLVVFSDPDKLKLWRSGHPTHKLLDCSDRASFEKEYNRPRCEPVDIEYEPLLTEAEAKAKGLLK